MIPADIATRLRMLTEASFFSGEPNVAPLSRVSEIPSDLPEFSAGQRFTAVLQNPLPDNTFRALVAGRTVTLALDHAAQAGDTLELVVTKVTPQAVFAALARPTPGADTALSPAGKLISFLLTGQPTPGPAALGAGQPLLAAPPQDSTKLAPALKNALSESGMFYESHQARWVAGSLDTNSLLREPQAKALTGADVAYMARAGAAEGQGLVPDQLQSLVHRQLEALATQQLAWQGQVWPGQTMEWEIENPPDRRNGGSEEEAQSWNTTLRLTLPRLGSVEAQLHLTPAGVAVRLRAGEPGTIEALRAGSDRLSDALAAADVPLTGMVVETGP